MKFKVTVKDPGTLHEAIEEAVAAEIKGIGGISDGERESLLGIRVEAVEEICYEWFRYGEYLSVEIDTEAKTCTILKGDD